MPTSIPHTVDPRSTMRPRRMSTEDLSIWERWRKTDSTPWLRFHYDVGVGPGKPVPAGTSPADAQFWQTETQKRVDVIGETADRTVLIELRQRAQPNAIGRMLVYQDLYAQDPLNEKPVEYWIITDTPDPDVARIAAQHGIRYVTI